MLSIIFILFASICNSIMDTCKDHFNLSIFSLIKQKVWWDGTDSWLNKYVDRNSNKGLIKWNLLGVKVNKPVQITDSWHFFKMIMIFMLCFSIIFYSPFITYFNIYLNFAFELIILGSVWNNTFSLFYNHVWKLKFWNFIFKTNV